jgi:formylglycine-generating enzyme required for sulfatase activity
MTLQKVATEHSVTPMISNLHRHSYYSTVRHVLVSCLLFAASPSPAKTPAESDYKISPQDSAWVMGNLNMVRISAGAFEMGTEDRTDAWLMHSRPIREVFVDSFDIGACEVTQAIFSKVMGFNPSLMQGDEHRPVDQVSWFDAALFCNRLSELAGYMPAYDIHNRSCVFNRNGFRLPTEAEWEYACRAGGRQRFYSGHSTDDLDRVAWFRLNSNGTTHPVGLKEPNAWGLYDMHGNVWEWCNDWMVSYKQLKKRNPHGPGLGNSRILRGGGWHYDAEGCHAAYRQRARPDYKISSVGFRLVRNPGGRGPLVNGEKRVPGYPYSVLGKSSQD